MKGLVRILLLVLIVASCGKGHGGYLIPENKLVKILADVHLADAMTYNVRLRYVMSRRDSVSYYAPILNKYGVTRKQFDSTIAWYSANPEKYDAVYEKVLDRMNRMQADLIEQMKKDSADFPKGNLWPLNKEYKLTGDTAKTRIPFSIAVHRKGTYILSANIKLDPTDKSINPAMGIWCAWPDPKINKPDSLHRIKLDKSGHYRPYMLTISLDKDTATFLRGFILGYDSTKRKFNRSAEVRNINLIFQRKPALPE